jgi:hypothetical protein
VNACPLSPTLLEPNQTFLLATDDDGENQGLEQIERQQSEENNCEDCNKRDCEEAGEEYNRRNRVLNEAERMVVGW